MLLMFGGIGKLALVGVALFFVMIAVGVWIRR